MFHSVIAGSSRADRVCGFPQHEIGFFLVCRIASIVTTSETVCPVSPMASCLSAGSVDQEQLIAGATLSGKSLSCLKPVLLQRQPSRTKML